MYQAYFNMAVQYDLTLLFWSLSTLKCQQYLVYQSTSQLVPDSAYCQKERLHAGRTLAVTDDDLSRFCCCDCTERISRGFYA